MGGCESRLAGLCGCGDDIVQKELDNAPVDCATPHRVRTFEPKEEDPSVKAESVNGRTTSGSSSSSSETTLTRRKKKKKPQEAEFVKELTTLMRSGVRVTHEDRCSTLRLKGQTLEWDKKKKSLPLDDVEAVDAADCRFVVQTKQGHAFTFTDPTHQPDLGLLLADGLVMLAESRRERHSHTKRHADDATTKGAHQTTKRHQTSSSKENLPPPSLLLV
mmetsp:Transcript_27/g.95  ORF Transcript_27/g.95 Transcript_27/m.95 type:complete len:218 (-) Transcript_27:77-730(-)